jgi:capsule biosynthesis phosphatase
MIYILLCGGIGNRVNYSLPKPLNYINGEHSIKLIINKIPSNELYIIYNYTLDNYNFKEIIINQCKDKKIYFNSIDFYTRGSVETAYIGIQYFLKNKVICDDKNICFLDNDCIHDYPFTNYEYVNSFIGYSIDETNKTNYSFIKVDNLNLSHDKEKNENNYFVKEIKEKEKISNNYCCGVYGFNNLKEFIFYSKKMIDENIKIRNEFYFSELYKIMINDNKIIIPVLFEKNIHIGSLNEIKENIHEIKNYNKKLRICFDLDNTLVTFPTIIGDYSSVLPIYNNIKLLKKMKSEGHEIIIYTARRMKTHSHNIGKVTKDIALVTIETLQKFEIEYDEIIFGKPYADIYIDDKSINPYINNISSFGFFLKEEELSNTSILNNKPLNQIINYISPNKYNKINCQDNIIIKSSKKDFIKGELFYYQNIPISLKHYFPIFYKNMCLNTYTNLPLQAMDKPFNLHGLSIACEDKLNQSICEISIHMEKIHGIPLYFLYKNKLLNEKHIDELFNILSNIHFCKDYPINIDINDIKNNYCKKIIDRYNIYKDDYTISLNSNETTLNGLFEACKGKLDFYTKDNIKYIDMYKILQDIINEIELNFNCEIVNVIHGDFWFSNILIEYNNNNYKLIDMKGIVNGILTLNGDKYYDYGKMLQSIIGYDCILHNDEIDYEYIEKNKKYFFKKCLESNLNIKYLIAVTKSLIFGSFTCLAEYSHESKNIFSEQSLEKIHTNKYKIIILKLLKLICFL